MPEEIARDQEGGPHFGVGKLGIPPLRHDRSHVAHQEIGGQGTMQQDGKEIH